MKRLPILLTVVVLISYADLAGAESKFVVGPKVPIKAHAFSLHDVRLAEGPFKRAMDLDAKYLLDLEPDRLLSRFRETAGLKPKGKIYGGWESRGLSGHTLGHYVSACSMMYAASGDKRFLERVNYIVDELAECQQAHGNGYVGGIPDAKRIFDEVEAGKLKTANFGLNGGWVPWYNLHKLYAGLIDAYRYCDNDKAKKVVTDLADWADKVTGKLSDEKFQSMLRCEHGGMNEALADVHAVTGDKKHLDLAGRFNHRFVIDPLSKREDQLEGLHANTQVPKLIGAARQYELNGKAELRTAAEFFWEVVSQHRSYVNGGNSDAEHFRKKGELWKHLSSRTAETCNTYNMLKLTRHLFAWTGDRRYADYYERALYNHILASQDPKKGMMIYFCSLKPGHFHTYNKPYDSFWCCTGSGIENHVKYGDSIYFHDEANLYVNLFIASELTWKDKGLTLRQETQFPEKPTTRFVLHCKKPVPLAIKIRQPSWATSAVKVAVNGKKLDVQAGKDGYVAIDRTWKDGDAVDVGLPMGLRIEPMENHPQKVAVLYGPIVLAGQLGRKGFTEQMPYAGAQWSYGNMPTPRVPVLVTDDKPVDQWLKPVAGKPLQFKTTGVGRPNDVSMIPFYQAHHQRFTVYWDVFTKKQWQVKEAEYEAEQRRLEALRARTVDEVVPEMQPERDHNVKGEKSITGVAYGRHWRHADSGGWFSYDMKVVGDKPVDLIVTYCGGETGNRTFDIQIDGQKIATQKLDKNKPGDFFDVAYPIPEKLTKDKAKVTVRFQPHSGATAGGVFGCRIVKREAKPAPDGAAESGDAQPAKHLSLDLGKGQTMKLVLIPAGKFQMGSKASAAEVAGMFNGKESHHVGEHPQHEVAISRPFYMGVHEVTQAQFRAVMGIEPWKDRVSVEIGDSYAASWVDWHEATEFCEKLSKKTGKKVALPTEAQWEYACRAGSTTMFCFGDDLSKVGDYGWYQDNTRKKDKNYAHPVGQKKPNAWGQYDMHGNVWEWCRDWYDGDFYAKPNKTDPENTAEAKCRAVRGGSWHNDPRHLRSAGRNSWCGPGYRHYNYGFRVTVASDSSEN